MKRFLILLALFVATITGGHAAVIQPHPNHGEITFPRSGLEPSPNVAEPADFEPFAVFLIVDLSSGDVIFIVAEKRLYRVFHDIQFPTGLADTKIDIVKVKLPDGSTKVYNHHYEVGLFRFKHLRTAVHHRPAPDLGSKLLHAVVAGGVKATQTVLNDFDEKVKAVMLKPDSFAKGALVTGPNKLMSGVGYAVMNPGKTGAALGYVVSNPEEVYQQAKTGIQAKWKTSGGKGELLFDTALIAVPVANALRGGKLASLSGAIRKMSVKNLVDFSKSPILNRIKYGKALMTLVDDAGKPLAVMREKAMHVVYEGSDSKVLELVDELVKLRGDSVSQLGEFSVLHRGSVLTFVAHGSETRPLGAAVVASMLEPHIARLPQEIKMVELIVCNTGTGKYGHFGGLLANKLGVRVAAPKGLILLDDGKWMHLSSEGTSVLKNTPWTIYTPSP